MRHVKTTLAVLGAATILVLAANTIAVAATGQPFLLGKSNSANNVTALTRTTSGSALKLQTATSTNPPLTVNGGGKVTNLNADKVDSYDSSVLLNKTTIFSRYINTTATSGFTLYTPTLPAGSYQVTAKGWIYGPTAGPPAYIICYARFGSPLVEQVMTVQSNGFYSVNLSGVLATQSADEITITCDGPTGNYVSYVDDTFQLSVTKIGAPVYADFAAGRVKAPRTTAAK